MINLQKAFYLQDRSTHKMRFSMILIHACELRLLCFSLRINVYRHRLLTSKSITIGPCLVIVFFFWRLPNWLVKYSVNE